MKATHFKAGDNPVARLLGKELVLLAWAIEDADPSLAPNAIQNWRGLAPEERWWLYTMTAAQTAHHTKHNVGWRKGVTLRTDRKSSRHDDNAVDGCRASPASNSAQPRWRARRALLTVSEKPAPALHNRGRGIWDEAWTSSNFHQRHLSTRVAEAQTATSFIEVQFPVSKLSKECVQGTKSKCRPDAHCARQLLERTKAAHFGPSRCPGSAAACDQRSRPGPRRLSQAHADGRGRSPQAPTSGSMGQWLRASSSCCPKILVSCNREARSAALLGSVNRSGSAGSRRGRERLSEESVSTSSSGIACVRRSCRRQRSR